MNENQAKQHKRWSRRALQAALLCPTLLFMAHTARAAVSVVITPTAPAKVSVNQPLNVSFSAVQSGKPVENNECQISELTYLWSVTISGVDAQGSTIDSVSYPLPEQGDWTGTSTPTIAHIANNRCQNYSVSATCTVSYKMKDCGDSTSGSTPGSTPPIVIEVEGTPCQPSSN